MFTRHIQPRLQEALTDTPVVLLTGARQVGKSTLAHTVAEASQAQYLTLDDAATLAAAAADPTSFVFNLPARVVIDEVQRVPELLLAVKASVDNDRRPGRFLLTGLADVLALPRVADSLAGRIEPLRLWPLSQGELTGHHDDFVSSLYSDAPISEPPPLAEEELRTRILRGGYPEAVGRTAPHRRTAWFESYVATIVQRDVRDLANIEGLHDLPRLLQLLAGRTSTLFNTSSLSRETGIAQSTLRRYLALLEATYLLQYQPASSTNITKRLTRAPKTLLTDTGLLSSLVGSSEERLLRDRTHMGQLLESFVVLEIYKQLGWSRTRATVHHYRTYAGQEVDILLEQPDGQVAALEVKATAAPTSKDFAGLRALRDDMGERFHRGALLYLGDRVLPFGDRLRAVPVQALWA